VNVVRAVAKVPEAAVFGELVELLTLNLSEKLESLKMYEVVFALMAISRSNAAPNCRQAP